MPEYLAPGVYVEETSFRAKSIEGVGTSTTAFVGPTRKGPVSGGEEAPERPELLTSFGDFERIYGGLADLDFGVDPVLNYNYVALAALAYFNEGGSRLYVSRVVVPPDPEDPESRGATPASVPVLESDGDGAPRVRFEARFPGTGGNGTLTVIETVAPASARTLETAPQGTLLRVTETPPPEPEEPEEPEEPGEPEEEAARYYVKVGSEWSRVDAEEAEAVDAEEFAGADAHIVTLLVIARDADQNELSWEDLGFDDSHPRGVRHVLAAAPARQADHLQNPFAIIVVGGVNAFELREALFRGAELNAQGQFQRDWRLEGGTDGPEPMETHYRNALKEIAGLEDVAIVAAPGSSVYGDAQGIMNALISHAETRRAYRIAVLDTPRQQTLGQVRELRGKVDSKHAAMYYPWVIASNPNARPGREDIPREIALPPSGYVCGIYARNDVQNGVHKAPANEVVRSALRFEFDVNFRQQELLNPLGINCLRLLPGRGYRVWGARLISSDPEWKYVSDRRYFNYLEASIDRGTQGAVFRPNGERLWANMRQTISDFLYNEWRNGALLGATPEEAFFVRCDRSTMTQNDLDNGRLICLIGVAIIKPAEFVIFRIGQKTADARA